jgi:hypothetical protein
VGGRGWGAGGPPLWQPPGKFPATGMAPFDNVTSKTTLFYHVEDNAKTAYNAGSVQYKKKDEFFWHTAATPTLYQKFLVYSPG